MNVLPSGEKPVKTDWGEAFTELLCHTSMSYEDICRRTIPQIETILSKMGKHISLRLGIPFQEGKMASPSAEHSVEDGMAFAAMFNGI